MFLADQPIYRVAPLGDFVAASFTQQRFRTGVLAIIAILGLVLAALGCYAVVGRGIVERLREIAIRRALGASPGHLCRIALADTAFALITGSAIGIPLALGILANSARLFPGMQPALMAALSGSLTVVIVTVTLVAGTLLPRVFKIDPALALKND